MSESFFIEPWRVEESADALTLREETSVSDFVLGGCVSLGISLAVAAFDVWLWRRGTIGGFIAAWLGFLSVLLAAKAIEQFFHGWRLSSRGPRCLMFHREGDTVELEGFRGPASGRVERIVIAVKSWPRERGTPYGHLPRYQYTVQLFVDGQRMELGTFGAEAAANRLAEAIANCVGIRAARLSESG